MRQIAIIGLSPTSHHLAPWGDPDWELWGLPWDSRWELLDRHFEMHDLSLLRRPESGRKPDYFDRLRGLQSLYMQESYTDIPNAMRYPLDGAVKAIGRDWFNSSMSYPVAMAIMYNVDRIGIWGVDMSADDEYSYQRDNMHWLIGVAEGKGIDVILPDESELMRFNGEGIWLGDMKPVYPKRYGWVE